jgi:hypothetical protein
VNANETPSLALSSNVAGPVETQQNVIFTAIASNTGGGALSYTFKKATSTLQSASSSNSYTAVAGSASFPAGETTTIHAELAITGGCVTTNTASSNNASLEVYSIVPVVWNGTSWSNGTGPATSDIVVLSNTYNGPSFTARNVTINPSTTLTIAPGSVIKATGILTNNGTITVEDGAAIFQGPTSTLAGSGTYKVKKTGSYIAYSYWSSPVVNARMFSGYNIYSYNESARTPGDFLTGWKVPSGNFQLGVGYAGAWAGARTFTGVINNGNVNRTVTRTNIDNNPDYDGWNLLGNPYPSTLELESFLTENSAILDQVAYFWNGKNYVTENYGDIAVCQGFFVHARSTGTVSFKNFMRSMGTNKMYRLAATSRIKLSIGNSTDTDVTQIELRDGFSDGYDLGYDALKLKGNDILQLYSRVKDHASSFAINILSPGIDKSVQLVYDAKALGTYTLKISDNTSSLPVYVLDKELNKLHDLSTPYTFQGGGVSGSERFVLLVSPSTTSTSSAVATESGKKSLVIWSHDKEVVINGIGMLDVKIKDMGGKTVATGMSDGSCVIKMPNSPAGLYMVFVNGVFAKKVLLH